MPAKIQIGDLNIPVRKKNKSVQNFFASA